MEFMSLPIVFSRQDLQKQGRSETAARRLINKWLANGVITRSSDAPDDKRDYFEFTDKAGAALPFDPEKPQDTFTVGGIDAHTEEGAAPAEALPDESRAILADAVARHRAARERSDLRTAVARVSELEDLLARAMTLNDRPKVDPRDRRIVVRYSATEITPVFMFSDLHCGEGVDREGVNHLNEYNPEIAARRGAIATVNALHLMDRARAAGSDIKSMVLWWGGDFINGYIHDSYQITNKLTPAEEQVVAFDILTQQLDYLLEHSKCEEIIVICNPGNHGRLTEKMVPGVLGKTSWEWALYQLIAGRYKDEKRVRFVIGDGYMVYQDIYDTRLCFHHGDAIRGGNGVGGLTVPLRRAIMKWHEQTPKSKQPFHILGHFHQLLTDMRTFFCNGSVVGYNGYAQRCQLPYEPPQQGLCFIAPGQRVPVEFHRVYCEGV